MSQNQPFKDIMQVSRSGAITQSMHVAFRHLTGIDLTNRLRYLTAQVKMSPTPHRPTGIAKARRAAIKRRNIARNAA